MNPPKSILDPGFKWVPAAATDLGKTFARVRREMKRQQEVETARREQAEREAHTVVPLQRKGRNG